VNCFLVLEEDGLTLVDTGLPTSAPAIVDAAAGIGQPLRRILLTHAHRDHAGGLDALLRASPHTALLLTRRAHEALRGRFPTRHETAAARLRRLLFTRSAATPTHYLKVGDEVGRLRLVDAPGHAPEHVAYYLEAERVLIAGDAFTTRGGRLRLVGHPVAPRPLTDQASNITTRLFTWHAPTAVRSAKHLHQLAPELLLVGHGPPLEDPLAALEEALGATLLGGAEEG